MGATVDVLRTGAPSQTRRLGWHAGPPSPSRTVKAPTNMARLIALALATSLIREWRVLGLDRAPWRPHVHTCQPAPGIVHPAGAWCMQHASPMRRAPACNLPRHWTAPLSPPTGAPCKCTRPKLGMIAITWQPLPGMHPLLAPAPAVVAGGCLNSPLITAWASTSCRQQARPALVSRLLQQQASWTSPTSRLGQPHSLGQAPPLTRGRGTAALQCWRLLPRPSRRAGACASPPPPQSPAHGPCWDLHRQMRVSGAA